MADLKTLFLATRPGFFSASVVPVLLGASVAWNLDNAFSPGYLVLTLLAVISLHAGMNVLNDYYDYLNGTDNINKTALPPFTGGSGLIQSGSMTPVATLFLGAGLVCAGSLLGLYLAITTSPLLFLIGGAGLTTGFFYSAPPLFLAGRGLGELTVGLDFGILPVLGSYAVQTGTLSTAPFLASLPLSFLIAAILFINEFPDMEADEASGKKTLVVRLGREKALTVLNFIIASAYASLGPGLFAGALPRTSLLALLSAPLALRATLIAGKTSGTSPALLKAIKSLILAHLSCGILIIIGELMAR